MSEAINIYTRLQMIQQAIHVGKDLDNEFAGFKYRSAESILEKLKPLLKENSVVVTLSDEIEDHSEQSYVKAWAVIVNCDEPTQRIEVSALAREEKSRPKMSEGQLTGAASSYARKYALSGLLLLDDNKDPDSEDNRPALRTPGKTLQGGSAVSGTPTAPPLAATPAQKAQITALLRGAHIRDENFAAVVSATYGYDLKALTTTTARELIEHIKAEPPEVES